MFIFRNDIFSLLHFVLQQSISDMTAKWSEISCHHVLTMFFVTATMSRFLDATYSEKGTVLGLIDRTFIVAILILSFEPEGPGFKLTSPASRKKI